MEVDKLFTDLADRRKLLRVLEIISGEKLGKTNSGRYIAQYHFFKCTKNKDLVCYCQPKFCKQVRKASIC